MRTHAVNDDERKTLIDRLIADYPAVPAAQVTLIIGEAERLVTGALVRVLPSKVEELARARLDARRG